MCVIIFGELFSFPEGNAATNRVYTYAKGLKENNINAYVVCFFNEYNIGNGVIDNISYYHPLVRKKRNRFLVVRGWQEFLKYIKTFSLVRKIAKKEKVIAINCWTNLLVVHLFAWGLSKIVNAKLIIESNEHPLRYFQYGVIRKQAGKVKLYIESHLCDGILCISKYLIDFYSKRGIPSKKLFLLPSTIDAARFKATGDKPVNFPYIGYFGGLTFKRDNVDLLVQAFAQLDDRHSQFHLVLGGFCSIPEKEQLKNLIDNLNIANKVELLGYLTRDEIRNYITHADILAMVRADNIESQASYPSKLTEFLATSKPVVTVNVGEVCNYLTDGVNAFLVEPGRPEVLAKKIDFILSNYEFAKQAGRQGKELTDGVFNYNYQAKRMIGFINSLSK